jgi:hypothetical protein
MICLLRLADTSIGGIEKVKYNVSQIDWLLENGLSNVVAKWTHSLCPAQKLLRASSRNLDKKRTGTGLLKTKGLEEESVKDEGKYTVPS